MTRDADLAGRAAEQLRAAMRDRGIRGDVLLDVVPDDLDADAAPYYTVVLRLLASWPFRLTTEDGTGTTMGYTQRIAPEMLVERPDAAAYWLDRIEAAMTEQILTALAPRAADLGVRRRAFQPYASEIVDRIAAVLPEYQDRIRWAAAPYADPAGSRA